MRLPKSRLQRKDALSEHAEQEAQGLYNSAYEHDACGVAFVARLDGARSHETIERALLSLKNLEHRGAAGADRNTGDGAGMLLQMPDKFFRESAALDFELPAEGRYGVAVCFLPRDGVQRRRELMELIESTVEAEGQRVLGWRDVPVEQRIAGKSARSSAPVVRQLFVAAAADVESGPQFERKLYVIRRIIERAGEGTLAIPSFSSRTLAYKGMLTSPQLPGYYPDLRDPSMESALALVHSRFSTNTFPSWELAHPYRMVAHNGEINAVMGNRNWMRARESQLASELFGDDIKKLLPIVQPGASDSATFDNVLELLVMSGRSLPHSMMMMMPEAYEERDDVPEDVRGFFDFHSCLMEPWDGPAVVAFTDGTQIGAMLDRNGLRPGRWAITKDGWVVLASECGTLPIEPEQLESVGRLRPGKLFVVDTERGVVLDGTEAQTEVATQRPYGAWYAEHTVHLDDLPEADPTSPPTTPAHRRRLAFGYSQEDLRILLTPMARDGAEPIGSMGADTSLAVMSDKSPALFTYFKQLFAQVTNPPIDPIRESCVMSLANGVGPSGNLLAESPAHAHQLMVSQPVLRNIELEKLRQVSHEVFSAETVDITWPASEGANGLAAALERVCGEAAELVAGGTTILILSDRRVGPDRVAIPSLLATAAVHHHLVREGTRLRAGLVIETGEAREVHHFATLIGYGASAINPYLMLESLAELREHRMLPDDLTIEDAERNAIKAVGKGLLKILSKMGISTVRSYCGAQIFEAVGLQDELINKHFTGTASRIGGVGLDELAQEAVTRHNRAFPASLALDSQLPVGGVYQWRRGGEFHQWNPDTVAALQLASRTNSYDNYEQYAALCNDEAARAGTLRGLLKVREDLEPIPIEEVEPAAEIVKRFSTGAMSLGAISPESHETLAIAMNRIGGRSNTGEGGEDPRRYVPDANGDWRRSSIKQVASGRFGVTPQYLVNADQIQIKMAQGAKPGEGGQLPGGKVDQYIAKLRHSTSGVGLISPPPHHDIYSIEDLKQLIYDLRCANPTAGISVKLVSEVGVGTVAAGVAKANADHVVVAGHDGGTGASPLSSIQSAGVPWEIGLAETQQTLLKNELRTRIAVEVDGQMKTGRDVAIAAMLGADQMGFSTAPLIVTGCIMMRVCHLNTCPVGIATQDPELRARFAGSPDHVVNFMVMVAEEVREIMASLGIARFEELIGRTDLLVRDEAIDHWKKRGVDLSKLLAEVEMPAGAPRSWMRPPDSVLDDHLDHELIAFAKPALQGGSKVQIEHSIHNVNRCVGGMLSGEIARARGESGLTEGSLEVTFTGSAGQSFGGWLAAGVEFTLFGETNDYAGKGLAGGVVAVRPAATATFVPEDNVIAGNTSLYGATSGKAFFRGIAGERFAVRNSGARTVVEGIGDHGCEYMTGGRVVVLGPTGRNFAAGMSGGIAYVYDPDGAFPARCNLEMVGFDEISEIDAIELRDLIAEHAERTGSTVASGLIENWSQELPKFVKVMPHDYKRVLAEQAEAGTAEVDPTTQSNGHVSAEDGAKVGKAHG